MPAKDIEQHYEIFSFLDQKGFRYYLPAYMVWTLKNFDTSRSASVDWVIYNLHPNKEVLEGEIVERFSLFTGAQCRAICRFLEFMAYEVGDRHADAEQAIEALDCYWGRFCI